MEWIFMRKQSSFYFKNKKNKIVLLPTGYLTIFYKYYKLVLREKLSKIDFTMKWVVLGANEYYRLVSVL